MSIFSAIAEAIVGVSQEKWDSDEYQNQNCQEDEPDAEQEETDNFLDFVSWFGFGKSDED